MVQPELILRPVFLELLPPQTEFLTVGARTRPSHTSMYPAYEDLSDEDLLVRLVAGDENAFTLLYRRRQDQSGRLPGAGIVNGYV